jgi:hypothetical protein
LKLSLLLIAMTACVLPVAGDPVTYTMTFTGGPFLNGVQENFAPESGSFNFDTTSGFSGFLVYYDGDIFDFTAAANNPTLCTSASPSSCSPATPAQELQQLMAHSMWMDTENSNPPGFNLDGVSTLSLGNFLGEISAQAPGFPFFVSTAPPAVGTFTITAAPEPGSFAMLSATTLAFLFLRAFRLPKTAKRSE